jgi:hypothetical protein
MPDYEAKEKAGWNLLAEISKEIHKYVSKGMNQYHNGNVRGWFHSFSAVREIINHHLNEKQTTELDGMENTAFSIEAQLRNFEEFVENKEKKKKQIELTNVVRKYVRKVMSLLDEYGYFPRKEDRTRI